MISGNPKEIQNICLKFQNLMKLQRRENTKIGAKS